MPEYQQLCKQAFEWLQAQKWAEAIQICEQAIKQAPQTPLAYQYLGLAYRENREYDKAEIALLQALKLAPNNLSTLNHLGRLFQIQQKSQRALDYFEEALKRIPASHGSVPRIQFNQALCWLALGDYSRGFVAYQAKQTIGDDPPPPSGLPYWTGESLKGKTLLLHSTEGCGDALFLLPLALQLKRPDNQILLICQDSLVSLFQVLNIFTQIWSEKDFSHPTNFRPDPRPDFYLPMYALPHLTRLTPEKLPVQTAYLKAPTKISRKAAYRKKKTQSGLQIGLVWACNRAAASFHRRSLALPTLLNGLDLLPNKAPKAPRKDTYYSLQHPSYQLNEKVLEASGIINMGKTLSDFASTAEALDRLDLLISIDTASAHLAAAMGKSVWLLLPYESDWRWQLEKGSSPWYPSIRIFRQPQPGDWLSVLKAIKLALAEFK